MDEKKIEEKLRRLVDEPRRRRRQWWQFWGTLFAVFVGFSLLERTLPAAARAFMAARAAIAGLLLKVFGGG